MIAASSLSPVLWGLSACFRMRVSLPQQEGNRGPDPKLKG